MPGPSGTNRVNMQSVSVASNTGAQLPHQQPQEPQASTSSAGPGQATAASSSSSQQQQQQQQMMIFSDQQLQPGQQQRASINSNYDLSAAELVQVLVNQQQHTV